MLNILLGILIQNENENTIFVQNLNEMEIKFGTDGWRAIIVKDYTVDNLHRVAEATAKYM
jgi:phosphomannomutase